MRFPSRQARAPCASPAGQFTFSSVPCGIGTCASSSTMRATKAATCSKSARPHSRATQESSRPWKACCEAAIAGIPSTTPSSAAATVPE